MRRGTNSKPATLRIFRHPRDADRLTSTRHKSIHLFGLRQLALEWIFLIFAPFNRFLPLKAGTEEGKNFRRFDQRILRPFMSVGMRKRPGNTSKGTTARPFLAENPSVIRQNATTARLEIASEAKALRWLVTPGQR